MAQATITIRVDQALKNKFDALCDDFGLSITSAFNIFMKAVVREQKIPFEITSKNRENIGKQGLSTFKEMQRIVAESGRSEMSLEEINHFIKQVRNEVAK